MAKIWFGLWCVACLSLQACSGPKLEPLSANADILAFGDSLTYGKGANNGGDYPAVLSKLTGLNVINAGVSGETTTQGLTRLTGLIEQSSPQLLILLEGGNDFLHNTDPDITKTNLAKMIELAQAHSISVVLIAVPQKSLFLTDASLYSVLAEIYDVVLIEDTLADLLKSPAMKSDTVHLNNAGYRTLAEAIHLTLLESGAL
ncbi:GDSL-type esterase/lipase family protein [Shewanella sp. D64]|uniref:GDSL-type esterase/lipase family protein n=1 Tax=unclassified Shewanella TaxID=196818 RepID=UPI0022BA1439|nr:MULTISPECIES: GDSL-type esterase/lipase family protein [unclassified Shewanella]MEC4725141.1 GDSL-type esterase/lipase family protein [Shewanella sp. D64]MEC4737042.1 GDSL-type esterase/lipase family protein [Shewanella sp. E94]WBJ96629.1 GDSL-type esterase/lipase family protein [Shewanella sp. MTB7]